MQITGLNTNIINKENLVISKKECTIILENLAKLNWPVGSIIYLPFYSNKIDGFLPCNGQTVLTTDYPDLALIFNINTNQFVIPKINNNNFIFGANTLSEISLNKSENASLSHTHTITHAHSKTHKHLLVSHNHRLPLNHGHTLLTHYHNFYTKDHSHTVSSHTHTLDTSSLPLVSHNYDGYFYLDGHFHYTTTYGTNAGGGPSATYPVGLYSSALTTNTVKSTDAITTVDRKFHMTTEGLSKSTDTTSTVITENTYDEDYSTIGEDIDSIWKGTVTNSSYVYTSSDAAETNEVTITTGPTTYETGAATYPYYSVYAYIKY